MNYSNCCYRLMLITCFAITCAGMGHSVSAQKPNGQLLPITTKSNGQRAYVRTNSQYFLNPPLYEFSKSENRETKPTPKSIVFEMRLIQVDTEQAKEIYQFVDKSTIQIGTAQLPQKTPQLTDKTQLSDDAKNADVVTVKSSSIEMKNQPVATAKIPSDQWPKLLAFVKSTTTANVRQLPTVTVFDNGLATINNTVLQPFVVGIKPISDSGKIAQQPIIQTVEEGVVFRVKGKIVDNDVRTQLEFVKSEITSVDTYSYGGEDKDSVITVQVPQQKICQALVTSTVADGQNLFVDLCSTTVQRPVEKSTLQKISLIENLKKSPRTKAVEQRLFLLLRLVVIESNQSTPSNKRDFSGN